MAIRDKFRRAIRKSAPASPSSASASSSTASIPNSSASSASAASSAASSPAPSAKSGGGTYRLTKSKTFSWGRGRAADEAGGGKKKSPSPPGRDPSPDPRERPFTKVNLEYQQMLEPFTMTFGATRSRGSFEGEGISPRNSLAILTTGDDIVAAANGS